MNIDRCVCHQVPFETLRPIVEQLRASGMIDDSTIFNQLRQQTKCSTDCSLCSPYIRRLIANGETSFTTIIQDTPNEYDQ